MQGFHALKPRHPQGCDRGFTATCQNCRFISVTDAVKCFSYGICGSRTGCHDSLYRPLCIDVYGYLSGSQVDQRHGDEIRRNPPGASLLQRVMILFDCRQPADARSNQHAELFRLFRDKT